MKKTLILGLLGLAAGVATSFGQGTIIIDNYNTGGPNITYGQAGIPANGVSGTAGTVGAALGSGWTEGFYFVVGNATASIAADATHTADPTSLGGGLTLATGTGSSAGIFTTSFGTAGEALAGAGFAVPGTAIAGGDTVTLMVVAYNGSSYLNSSDRGHSAAYTITTSANNSGSPTQTGVGMSTFGVFIVPEPSVFALAGLGGAFLMMIRRKK